MGREFLQSRLLLLLRDVRRATGMVEQFHEAHPKLTVSLSPLTLHSYWCDFITTRRENFLINSIFQRWPPEAMNIAQADNDGAWFGLRFANWPKEMVRASAAI